MSEANDRPPPGDVLDRAAAAVRATPAPPADFVAAAVAAVHTQVTLAVAADAVRRGRRRRIMRGISVGGLAAGLAVGVGLLWGGGAASAAGLKRALDNQARAESWRAVTRLTVPDPKGGKPGVVEQALFCRGDVLRVEMDGAALVFGADRTLLLDTRAKTARLLDGEGAPADPARAAAAGVADGLAAAELKEVPVPAVEIGGRKRPGYRVTLAAGPGGPAVVTYYLDAEKDVPVRMTVELGTGAGKVTSVTDYLGYGEALDPELFRLDVPVGYTRVAAEPPAAKP